ncbi:MAG: Lrp/AsnC family transcriptional regulator [Candidatus Bathyarchaeia archaeon]
MQKKSQSFYIYPTKKINSNRSLPVLQEAQAVLKLRNNSAALDDTDLRILQVLQENARQTYTAIGKRVGIAHSTVYDRLKRMEQHGIIGKYAALIDAEKAGVKSITALVTIYTDPKVSEKVAEKLCEAPEVLEVYTSLSEELQIMAKVVAETQEHLHEFIANSVAPLPGVLRVRTSVVTKKFKEQQFSVADSSRVNIYKRST